MFEQIAKDRVENGIGFLDRNIPNWRSKVKLTSCYDLIDLRNDVFGGIFNLGEKVGYNRSLCIGFGFTLDPDDNMDEMIGVINKVWREALIKELAVG